jgi:hypothetical protein
VPATEKTEFSLSTPDGNGSEPFSLERTRAAEALRLTFGHRSARWNP